MMSIDARARTRLHGLLSATTLSVLLSCTLSTEPDGSFFEAKVWLQSNGTGVPDQSIRGSARVSSSATDWSRESVVEVTLPNVGPLSGVVLSGAASTLSFIREGTEVPLGTHRLPRGVTPGSGAFSGGYTVRRSNALRLFSPDSGTLSITENGDHVGGTFTLYTSDYHDIPLPTKDMKPGTQVPTIGTGRTPMVIAGAFRAVRRK